MKLLLKNLLFTFLLPGTVAVYLPLLIVGDRGTVSGLAFALGCTALGLGAAIYAWCVWDFASFGRGTPAPIDAPKRLVVRGLYRYTRNPMYVGVLTTILGWAILFRAADLVLYAVAVGGCFQLFIVLYEEPHLRRLFGTEYERYRARVGRWLPRVWQPPDA
jgi:protein-S-isoprenylcysteine O-methyltransferase Ste14